MRPFSLIVIVAVAATATAAQRLPHSREKEPVQTGQAPQHQPDVFPPPGSVPNGGGGGGGARGATSRPTSRPSAADAAEVRQAESALTDVEKKLREKYQADPAYAAAAAAEKQAQADYDAAAAKTSTSLAGDPAYAKAQSDLKTAEADLEAARTDSAKRDELPTRAMAAMQARDTLRRLETQARATDPTVTAAADKRAAAAAELAKVRAKFEADMKNDPDYQAAEKALADARGNARH